MIRLNGWQRIGVVLSALWCLAVIGFTANGYYKAYANYSHHLESDAYSASCSDNARKGPSPEKTMKACPLSETEITDRQATRPPVPPATPVLALILLPIAGVWLVVYFAMRATKWIREGFKIK